MRISRRLFAAAAMGAAFVLTACGGGSGSGPAASQSGDRTMGDDSAPVTLVEYASVACGHCAEFHEEVWPMIHDDYIETGQVRFVFREMLTGPRNFAIAGFQLAHCVGDDRYFEMIDVLMEQQGAIFRAAQSPSGPRAQYLSIARSFGMSEQDFNECLSNRDLIDQLNAANEQALADGITGTPRFMINGAVLDADRSGNYLWQGRPLMINGETVPARVDEDTFRLILDHFVAQSSGDTGGADTAE